MSQLNDRYAELFEIPSQEELEEEKSSGSREGNLDENTGGDQGYAWMGLLDVVSETLRTSWHDVLHISVIEFLNIAAYRKEKNRKEKEALEKWKRSN